MLYFEPTEIRVAARKVLDCHVRQALLESKFPTSMSDDFTPAECLFAMMCDDGSPCPRVLGAIDVVCLYVGVKVVASGEERNGLLFTTMDQGACSLLFRRVRLLLQLSVTVQPSDLPSLTKACSVSRHCTTLRCNEVDNNHQKCQARMDWDGTACAANDEDSRRWQLTVHLAMCGKE